VFAGGVGGGEGGGVGGGGGGVGWVGGGVGDGAVGGVGLGLLVESSVVWNDLTSVGDSVSFGVILLLG